MFDLEFCLAARRTGAAAAAGPKPQFKTLKKTPSVPEIGPDK